MASGRDKAKFKLIDTLLLPHVWFTKLRAMRRTQKQRPKLKAPDNHKPLVTASFTAFLPDAADVESSDGKRGSPNPPFSPLSLSDTVEIGSVDQQFCRSPHNRESCDVPRVPESQIWGSFMLPLVKSNGTIVPVNPLRGNSVQSSHVSESSGCAYMSAMSSLRNLGKFAPGDTESATDKENSPASFRRVAPSVRAWLLAGCGTVSRSRTCEGSLDLDTDSVIEVDERERLECSTDEKSIKTTGPNSVDKWSREHSATSSMELASIQGEVVNEEVLVKKLNMLGHTESEVDRLGSQASSPDSSSRQLEVFQHNPSLAKRCASPPSPMNFTEPEEAPTPMSCAYHVGSRLDKLSVCSEESIRGHEPPLLSPFSSFASGEHSSLMISSELGIHNRKKSFRSTSDSEVLDCSQELDISIISDNTHFLGRKILAADSLHGSSGSWREDNPQDHELTMRSNDEIAILLMDSLCNAFEQRNLKALLANSEAETETDGQEPVSNYWSPNSRVHDPPVFESYLEEPAHSRWGSMDSVATSKTQSDHEHGGAATANLKSCDTASDMSRELHCITVQSTNEADREGPRHGTTAIDPHAAARRDAARRAKRFTQRQNRQHGDRADAPSLRRKFNSAKSNSRRESKNRTERDMRSRRAESMADVDFMEDFNNARHKLRAPGSRSPSRLQKNHHQPRSRSNQLMTTTATCTKMVSTTDMQRDQAEVHGVVKESVAVVKSSYDPYNDFRESMVEMIVEKEIQQTADLEELLQCYLSLNEVEYHTVIVNVFTDVWQELFGNCQ